MQNPFLRFIDDERKQTILNQNLQLSKSDLEQMKSRSQSSVMIRGTHTLFDKYNSNRVNCRDLESIIWSEK